MAQVSGTFPQLNSGMKKPGKPGPRTPRSAGGKGGKKGC